MRIPLEPRPRKIKPLGYPHDTGYFALNGHTVRTVGDQAKGYKFECSCGSFKKKFPQFVVGKRQWEAHTEDSQQEE